MSQKKPPEDPESLVRWARKATSSRELRDLLITTIRTPGVRVRRSRRGVVVTSPFGITSTGLTPSDHRSVLNFRSELRRIGVGV